MKYVNSVHLVGRLGKDVEVRHIGSTEKASFSLATETNRKDANGEWQKSTQWHNVVAWGDRAKAIDDLGLAKGSWCEVEGKIETRSWEGKDGKKQYLTEIVAWHVTVPEEDDSPKREKKAERRDTQVQKNISEPIDDSEIPF